MHDRSTHFDDAESGFIRDLMHFTLDEPDVQPLVCASRDLDFYYGAEGPDSVGPLCGVPGREPIPSTSADLRYEDRKCILTVQEAKILRWTQRNFDQSGRNIYLALIALRVMIGAESPTIACYRCQVSDAVVYPDLPVQMALMSVLGVHRDDVPAWADIVHALARATGRVKQDVKPLKLLLLRLLSGILLNIVDARTSALNTPGFNDRSGEVEDRVRAIIETIPKRDLAESGAHGQAGRASEGGKRPTPAPRGPRPRPRSPRPRMF
ncbi:hypothetical protein AA12717_3727 [Gluconacetobacter sacchari DSM 12717]|uniref:Uncharacterized protein n=2 Tax=Gluconacetobacter sacchari TaxID=92759 RepID=A0A7W4I9Y2_9PROT|nr:hypothetical protein [Gluconacetobacter sacchari]MBB2158963.1 hypothetical protein [Gluconacetobacter sacchari]GBQ31324.1 hypothetical protein AA12717_3727 [Gluconacetobacter sacchari DSM 12717]